MKSGILEKFSKMPMMIMCDKLSYIPGQIITGHVVIISKSPQKVKGLTMRFIGRSSKLLGEVEGTKRYKKEVYFDEKMDIFGHDGSNTQLRVGETLYPFTFPLPPGLPSSFEWPDGNVLYFVEAKLTRASWKDKRVSTRIQVEGVYDLNMEPSIMTPIEVKRQKYVKHLLTKSGPYGFTFKCNRSGFVRGHSLPFSVEIRNLSKVDSRKLRVSLLQEVKLECGKPVATLVEQMKGPPVTAGEVVTWEARLKIPGGIPPSNLGNVLSYPVVINVDYFMHIQLSLRNCREEPICIKIPVTVGTIAYNRRALSVPALDDENSYLSYASNGHRMDCPMSQLILPSAAISTSQFSPHLVSVNTASSYTHTQVTRGHSLGPQTLPSYNNSRVQILPVRQYEYYFEYEDASGSTRSVTSRGDSLFQRRRNQSNVGLGTERRRYFAPQANYNHAVESPPPSYEEIFTRERISEAPGSIINPDITSIQNSVSPGEAAIHKTVLSAQNSSSSSASSSSSEDDEYDENPALILSSANDAANSGSSSGRESVTPVNSESEEDDEEDDDEDDDDDDDDDACSTISANEEFLSCSGSSSSFEEFKCHDLQNASNDLQLLESTREEDTELNSQQNSQHHHHHRCGNNNRPCPCGKVNFKHNKNKSISNISDVQGSYNNTNNSDQHVYRHNHEQCAFSTSDKDGCFRNANNNSIAICGNSDDEDDS